MPLWSNPALPSVVKCRKHSQAVAQQFSTGGTVAEMWQLPARPRHASGSAERIQMVGDFGLLPRRSERC